MALRVGGAPGPARLQRGVSALGAVPGGWIQETRLLSPSPITRKPEAEALYHDILEGPPPTPGGGMG